MISDGSRDMVAKSLKKASGSEERHKGKTHVKNKWAPRKKRAPLRLPTYTLHDMRMAVEAVQKGRYSQTDAAKEYGVPRQTLSDKLRGKLCNLYWLYLHAIPIQ